MRRYKLEQLRVNNQTKLSDMAMQIKVSAMKLNRMKVELRNEHYLDSLVPVLPIKYVRLN